MQIRYSKIAERRRLMGQMALTVVGLGRLKGVKRVSFFLNLKCTKEVNCQEIGTNWCLLPREIAIPLEGVNTKHHEATLEETLNQSYYPIADFVQCYST